MSLLDYLKLLWLTFSAFLGRGGVLAVLLFAFLVCYGDFLCPFRNVIWWLLCPKAKWTKIAKFAFVGAHRIAC